MRNWKIQNQKNTNKPLTYLCTFKEYVYSKSGKCHYRSSFLRAFLFFLLRRLLTNRHPGFDWTMTSLAYISST